MFSVVSVPRRGRWTSDTLLESNSMQINAKTKIHCCGDEVEPGAASLHCNVNVCKTKKNLKLEQYFLKRFFLHCSTQTLPVRRTIQGRFKVISLSSTDPSQWFGISHFASNTFSKWHIYFLSLFSCNRKFRHEILEHGEHLTCVGVAWFSNWAAQRTSVSFKACSLWLEILRSCYWFRFCKEM